METRAFVLHLARAEKRRANARNLLETCGPKGRIWPAVDGNAISARDLEATVGAGLFDPPYPFGLKTGEIGCFLSHRQIWAEMQASDDAEAALIIEDDAALDPAVFGTALELARGHVGRLGYIQFQTRPPTGPGTLVDTAGPCALTVPETGGLRTTAQIVGKQAAAHLLRLSEVIDRPVDTFVQSHWHTGLRPAMIFPSGVTDIADSLDGSTIQAGRKPVLEKLRREVLRARYRHRAARFARHSRAPEKGGLAGD